MATLYAQSNHAWSARSGKWNTAANGSGATQDPTTADTLVANGKTITVDTNLTAVEINTSASGGQWAPSPNVTINANVVAGTTTCVFYNSAGAGTVTINGNVSGSSTTASANGAQMGTSCDGTMIVNGNIYGGGSLGQVTSTSCSGVYVNGTSSSMFVAQGGTVFAGVNSVGINHQTGTLRIYSHLKGNIVAAVSLNRTTTNTVEIGTPSNPVTISSGDRPFPGAGLRLESGAQNYTVNIHCSGLNALGTNAILSSGGNVNTVTLTMYGGAVVKGTNATAFNIGSGSSSALFTINGDVYGNDYGNNIYGIQISAPVTVVVNGDVYGGQTLLGVGLHGINIASTAATVTVNGTVYAGKSASANGINKAGLGHAAVINARKAVGSAYGDWLYGTSAPSALANSFAIDNIDYATTCNVGSTVSGPYGSAAVRGFHVLNPTIAGVTVPCYNQRRESPNGATSTTISYALGVGSSSYMPSAGDVLLSYTFGVTASPTTGTLATPAASDVYYGVPVGSTTGTAYAAPADILNYPVSSVASGTIGEKMARTLTCEELAAILAAQPN